LIKIFNWKKELSNSRLQIKKELLGEQKRMQKNIKFVVNWRKKLLTHKRRTSNNIKNDKHGLELLQIIMMWICSGFNG